MYNKGQAISNRLIFKQSVFFNNANATEIQKFEKGFLVVIIIGGNC